MGNKIYQQVRKARKAGMNELDVLRVRTIAKQEAEKMEQYAVEKGLVASMTVIFNLLIEDYWQKTAPKRVPKLAEDAIGLWEAIIMGVVDYEDCVAYVEECTGMKFNSDWIQHTGNARKVDGLKGKMRKFIEEAKNNG